jgi:ligand-binding sensor protein
LSRQNPFESNRLRASDEEAGHVAGEFVSSHEDRPDIILASVPIAVSGAIAGFVFAGQIVLAAGVFLALLLGLMVGWWARGNVEKWRAE